jgi:DNA-binding NarL/FixJ family response regulator
MQATSPTRIYIVDDSAAIRGRLAEMLGRIEGVSVVGQAAGASEAIEAILKLRPDGVLLDLNLMGRTGIDVLRVVHPEAPQIVFIVLTNHSEPQYRAVCDKAGASYFLDKTRDFERVSEVIAEIAARHH